MSSSHRPQHAAQIDFGPTAQNTVQASRAKTLGVSPRMLGKSASSAVRSNETLRGFRERMVDVLERALTTKNPTGLAASINVARTLVVRWLDKSFVDRRPAPMAWLLAMDADEFEAVVTELRAERAR